MIEEFIESINTDMIRVKKHVKPHDDFTLEKMAEMTEIPTYAEFKEGIEYGIQSY